MPRRRDEVLRRILLRGTVAALLVTGIASCNDDAKEMTSVEAPIVAGVTDDAFRVAAGCPDCTVIARSAVTLPLTGKAFTEVKLASASTHAPHNAALDGAGSVVDPGALLAAEGAARIARQGKLRDDAYAASLTASSDLVPISIWADFRDEHLPKEALLADTALRTTHESRVSAKLRAVTSRVTSWLDARGFRTHDRGIDSPVITADVPSTALAELGRLDGIAMAEVRSREVAHGTHWFRGVYADTAQTIVSSAAGQAFCTGEGGQPDNYPYLNVPASQMYDASAAASWHPRWTSELIAANTGTRMAPNASIWMAAWNGTSNTKYSAWQWCYSNGVGSLNRSAGTGNGSKTSLVAEDMAQDWYVYHSPWPLITLSAGNCLLDPADDASLTSCSNAGGRTAVTNRSYNTLNVGASDAAGTDSRSDDTLAFFSSYANPTTTHGDFELPNLLAPGMDADGYGSVTNIDSVAPMTSVGGIGTSASAPIAMGTVLLMKARDGTFQGWPEMTRATVLAAATRPVGTFGRTTRLGQGVDLKQGAGSLNAVRAVQLADPALWTNANSAGVANGRVGKTYFFSSDFPNGTSSDVYNISINTTGRLRVVIAWDASAVGCNSTDGSGCTGDAIDADLDLWLLNSSGGFACTSSSYDSSWEICDIAVTSGQTYTAKLHLNPNGINQSTTYLGIAWNNYSTSTE